jgi:hypothetical protein
MLTAQQGAPGLSPPPHAHLAQQPLARLVPLGLGHPAVGADGRAHLLPRGVSSNAWMPWDQCMEQCMERAWSRPSTQTAPSAPPPSTQRTAPSTPLAHSTHQRGEQAAQRPLLRAHAQRARDLGGGGGARRAGHTASKMRAQGFRALRAQCACLNALGGCAISNPRGPTSASAETIKQRAERQAP